MGGGRGEGVGGAGGLTRCIRLQVSKPIKEPGTFDSRRRGGRLRGQSSSAASVSVNCGPGATHCEVVSISTSATLLLVAAAAAVVVLLLPLPELRAAAAAAAGGSCATVDLGRPVMVPTARCRVVDTACGRHKGEGGEGREEGGKQKGGVGCCSCD